MDCFVNGIWYGFQKSLETKKTTLPTQPNKNLLDLLDDKTIAIKTGLSIETVKSFKGNKH